MFTYHINLSSEGNIEIAAVGVDQRDTILISIYRPPLGDVDVFFLHFNDLLTELECELTMKAVVIAGDFNFNFMENNTLTTRFYDLVETYNLNVLFNEPSGITEHSQTCIDNIVTNISREQYRSDTVNLHISDHCAQKFYILDSSTGVASVGKNMAVKNIRIINATNNSFREKLNSVDWSQTLNGRSA